MVIVIIVAMMAQVESLKRLTNPRKVERCISIKLVIVFPVGRLRSSR
jgi:hypothetical protein